MGNIHVLHFRTCRRRNVFKWRLFAERLQQDGLAGHEAHPHRHTDPSDGDLRGELLLTLVMMIRRRRRTELVGTIVMIMWMMIMEIY